MKKIIRRIAYWLLRITCDHCFIWRENIYGDEIIECGGKRSLWSCYECGTEDCRDALNEMSIQ